MEKYLDCGNPRCGFARIRCPDCRAEHLLTFSCKTRRSACFPGGTRVSRSRAW
ncbi:MAG: transposase zinc-binding domain-containing protein [Candidatus Aminicenantes bacterium]|nr:transposase zinc-binding domain-containing protein [Candidatus Aminicenantes bacterium]